MASAKTGENVNDAMLQIAARFLEAYPETEEQGDGHKPCALM